MYELNDDEQKLLEEIIFGYFPAVEDFDPREEIDFSDFFDVDVDDFDADEILSEY